jgi:hypothetical protein
MQRLFGKTRASPRADIAPLSSEDTQQEGRLGGCLNYLHYGLRLVVLVIAFGCSLAFLITLSEVQKTQEGCVFSLNLKAESSEERYGCSGLCHLGMATGSISVVLATILFLIVVRNINLGTFQYVYHLF